MFSVAGIAIATGWAVRGSNPGEVRDFSPVRTDPGARPASCTMGTESFPGINSGRVVTLTSHTLLVPWSRKRRAITLLFLWTVRSVQGLGVCISVVLYLFYFHEGLHHHLKFLSYITFPNLKFFVYLSVQLMLLLSSFEVVVEMAFSFIFFFLCFLQLR